MREQSYKCCTNRHTHTRWSLGKFLGLNLATDPAVLKLRGLRKKEGGGEGDLLQQQPYNF